VLLLETEDVVVAEEIDVVEDVVEEVEVLVVRGATLQPQSAWSVTVRCGLLSLVSKEVVAVLRVQPRCSLS